MNPIERGEEKMFVRVAEGQCEMWKRVDREAEKAISQMKKIRLKQRIFAQEWTRESRGDFDELGMNLWTMKIEPSFK